MNDEVVKAERASKPPEADRGEPEQHELTEADQSKTTKPEPTEAERTASLEAIQSVSGEIRARARGLRRLSHLLLLAVVSLLIGGLTVLFYSQILLIANSTEQSNAIRKSQERIDQEKKNLDEMASEFAKLRQDIAAAAAVAAPPTLLVFKDLVSVIFAGDGRHGWAVGERGTILATQNGGESWQTQPSDTTNNLGSVVFAGDGRRGWAVGGRGTILATQNGGESWQTHTSGTINNLWTVVLAGDGRRGWAVGDSGTILATQNGGESWQTQKAARSITSGRWCLPARAGAAGRWETAARSSPRRTAARAG
jgi:Photosynthesis system II assembly factor YCF48